MTDIELKKFLAERLPEKIALVVREEQQQQQLYYAWVDSNGDCPEDWFEVRDTEWEHIGRLVEEKLTSKYLMYYEVAIQNLYNISCFKGSFAMFCLTASWQFRATALYQV